MPATPRYFALALCGLCDVDRECLAARLWELEAYARGGTFATASRSVSREYKEALAARAEAFRFKAEAAGGTLTDVLGRCSCRQLKVENQQKKGDR